MPAIPNAASYGFSSPNGGADAGFSRASAIRIASHLPVDQPHLSFVHATAQAAFATIERVQQAGAYQPSVAYPNNGLGLALRTVAGAMVRQTGTRVFWVQTGGFDTHAGQGTNANGTYVQKSFDLSAWKGRTVSVKFLMNEDYTLQTSFVVDDTAVTVG